MGGARCSYQNCSQKSDKKTHMFHYPVFDKVRCHQWITNAQKLNYLNLKLSQLKNRMICQHHFTDDSFMNVMKNKLKNNAIPTENGPYCFQSYKKEDEAQGSIESELPINIDDIENEFTPTTDRRAHFSVKYGDFLTNDVSEAITLSPYKSTSIKLKDKGMIFNRCKRKMPSFQINQTPHNSNTFLLDTNAKNTNFKVAKHADKESADESRKCMFENKLPNPKFVAIESDELNLNTRERNTIKISDPVSLASLKPNSEQVGTIKSSSSTIPPSKKVRIISEKHISEPVKIPPGELQPVSPSIIIKVPDKQRRSNIEIDGKEIKTFYVDDFQNFQSTNKVQDFENMHINTYTHSPQVTVTDPMHVNTYTQPTTFHVDQIGLSNLAIQNEDPRNETKPMDYLPTEANQNIQHLGHDPGLFTNIDNNMSTTPNVEFVSGSKTGPSVFTLTDVPQVKTSMAETSYMDNLEAKNALLSMDSEMLSVNQKQVSSAPMKADHIFLESNKNIQSVVKETSTPNSVSPNKSMTKYKMHPEKLAAIEEKRKYNMKLRDIINSCLNNMDDEPDIGKLTEGMKKELSKKKVGEYLSKDSKRPNTQEDIISYFETRLQRMEDNLLNKIEQNSQKITDLKKTLKKQIPIKKSDSTQTYFTAEATKRNLYEQVSQYLTPGTNSLIYEELFINQCLSKTVTKRRKRKYNSDYIIETYDDS